MSTKHPIWVGGAPSCTGHQGAGAFAGSGPASSGLGRKEVADVLALGAITAIENCAGPQIAFRGGRIDAAEPNKPGVPQPQQDLKTHIGAFARQGFTQTETIGLVACGAKEYISGTTQNPLVVGSNDTTNSDKRIFGSDGNATMHLWSFLSSLLAPSSLPPPLHAPRNLRIFATSPSLFTSTCSKLFAKMLNTVPVKLKEVIRPLPVKPGNLELTLDGDELVFSGTVRRVVVLFDLPPC
ncbi:heme peroxidase [Mycena leptocephala]|nr:heme peroxidase [Mycena leptocephala]